MQLDVRHDFHVEEVVKKLMALPLLPADRIRDAFNLIKNAQTHLRGQSGRFISIHRGYLVEYSDSRGPHGVRR